MKIIPPDLPSASRPDLLRAKHRYGIWFGVAMGVFFALPAWGIDAYLLDNLHAFHPWLKFLIGITTCMTVGGFAGWLSARIDKPLLAVLFWVIAGAVFAWLTIFLPFQIAPRVSSLLEPDLQGLLHYTYYESLSSGFGITYFWIGIFISLAGLLQIPLSDSAVFSPAIAGRVTPMLVALLLMGSCGSIVDDLSNEALRSPIDSINAAIQYSIDHRGQPVNTVEARALHVGALRAVQDLVTPGRRFIVSGYDEFLGEVQVLVRFDEAWVECTILYDQPGNCEQVGNTT